MNKIKSILIFFSIILHTSCGIDFLDEKSNANLVVPTTIADYQAVLDRKAIMNQNTSLPLAMTAGEEFEVSREAFDAMAPNYITYQNAYIWNHAVHDDRESNEWNYIFQRIMYANLALDVGKISPTPSEKGKWNNAKGIALFFHSWNYYQLMQQFGKPWSEAIQEEVCPIPYREIYGVQEAVEYVTYGQFYQRMVEKLLLASELLPTLQNAKTRPNKAASLVLLARIFLQLHDYDKAMNFSRAALDAYPMDLMDFNEISLQGTFPFPADDGQTNNSILYYHLSGSAQALGNARMNVSSDLLDLYDTDDLRREVYFQPASNGRVVFRGSYHGGINNFFVGLSIEEAYLIHAECAVRLEMTAQALKSLNHLLKHRYKTNKFVPIAEDSANRLIGIILQERRKELCFRGIRWEDLRRLNEEGLYPVSLVRNIGSQNYENRWDTGVWHFAIPLIH